MINSNPGCVFVSAAQEASGYQLGIDRVIEVGFLLSAHPLRGIGSNLSLSFLPTISLNSVSWRWP
jgi:hypothetical protein